MLSACKTGQWQDVAIITPISLIHKRLSDWTYDTAISSDHRCRVCHVPDAAAIKKAVSWEALGGNANDFDVEWGDFYFVRAWNEARFMASLRRAENMPLHKLKAGGHRSIMIGGTTDPYQIVRHSDPAREPVLTSDLRYNVSRAVELIYEQSTLNVRVLTRSPRADWDFYQFEVFGPRLMFGVSLPTLRDDLAKTYEPTSPAPSQRLATLKAAKELEVNIFAVVAPTVPESDENDLHETLKAVAALEPMTIFHEPILQTDVFETREEWQEYAVKALRTVQVIARDLKVEHKLHLWPDKSLGSKAVIKRMPNPDQYRRWLHYWWNRVSEWPQVIPRDK